jgi:TolA-binding protein
MDCQEIARSELAEEYLHGRLDAARQDDYEAHILECERCLCEVEALQTARYDLAERAQEVRAYSVSGGRPWWSWVAVAALFLIFSGIGIRRLLVHPHAQSEVAQQKPANAIPIAPSSQPEMSASAGVSGSPVLPGVSAAHSATVGAPPRAKKPSQGHDRVSAMAHDLAPLESASATGKISPTAENPTTEAVTKPGSAIQVSDEIAQLAAVRPLPANFPGIASSQPSGDSTRRFLKPPQMSARDLHAQDYFRDAMSSYVDSNYETAGDLFGEAVKLDPQFAEANLYLGICRLLKGKTGDALSPLQSASQEKKLAVSQAAHFYLAKAYLRLGRLADAENELHAAAATPGPLMGESNSMIQQLQTIRSAPDNNK